MKTQLAFKGVDKMPGQSLLTYGGNQVVDPGLPMAVQPTIVHINSECTDEVMVVGKHSRFSLGIKMLILTGVFINIGIWLKMHLPNSNISGQLQLNTIN